MPEQNNNSIFHDQMIGQIQSRFSDSFSKTEIYRDQLVVFIRRERLLVVMSWLKDDPDMQFDFLVDLTAVDYIKMEKSPRFQVVYNLRSMKYGKRLRIKVPVPENDCRIDSVYSLWKSANWMEREVHEMYGILFEGHPDLRRLLTPETFVDYPLRKDYPLRGKGEREILLPEGS
jgi:NADH-quinone oxidoreductase subunit C